MSSACNIVDTCMYCINDDSILRILCYLYCLLWRTLWFDRDFLSLGSSQKIWKRQIYNNDNINNYVTLTLKTIGAAAHKSSSIICLYSMPQNWSSIQEQHAVAYIVKLTLTTFAPSIYIKPNFKINPDSCDKIWADKVIPICTSHYNYSSNWVNIVSNVMTSGKQWLL